MHKLEIYGSSDDLIEIEGDFTEEIGHYGIDDKDDNPFYLAISDGTLLRVRYDGCWRFTLEHKAPATNYSKREATDEGAHYSDRVLG